MRKDIINVLNKIIDEEKLFISEKGNNFIINGDSEVIKDLEIFRDINFEEIDFYIFYVNYLSKKEYENKKSFSRIIMEQMEKK